LALSAAKHAFGYKNNNLFTKNSYDLSLIQSLWWV